MASAMPSGLSMSAQWIWDSRRKLWSVQTWFPSQPAYLGKSFEVDTTAPMDEWARDHVIKAMSAEMESWLPW